MKWIKQASDEYNGSAEPSEEMCIRDRTMSLRSKTPKTGRLSCKKCAIFERRTATDRLRTSNKVPFAPSHRPLQDSMVQN